MGNLVVVPRKNIMITLVCLAVALGTGVSSAFAATSSIQTCLSDSYAQVNETLITFDGINETTYTVSESIYCANGCSYTLAACRPNSFDELMNMLYFFAAILLFCGLVIALERITDSSIDVPLLIIAALFVGIIAGITDVFSAAYRFVIIGFATIPIIMLYTSSFKKKDEERDHTPTEVEV